MRPALQRKDSQSLYKALFWYLPFFLVGQELILILPFFAFIYMDMPNHPASFFKALYGTGRLVLCHLPVVLFLITLHGLLLCTGRYLTLGLGFIGLPNIIAQALVPMAWFIVAYSLFFSACAMYYTKVKHTDRELLFGKQ